MEINADKCRLVGERLGEALAKVEVDQFTDPRYYPSPSEDDEMVARYFLVMVAMDHRLSRPGRPYEAYVGGEFYHGADLLYRLGMEKYREDPGFFDPRSLARVTAKDVEEWLSADGASPPDPEVRAALLRDLGEKLLALYGGSTTSLLEASGGYLKRLEGGFIDRLKVFRAYEDPVEKKAYLLAKFLERRRIIEVRDPWNMEVPVDNHLVRIALRLGLVEPPRWMLDKILGEEEFSWEEDVMFRLAVRRAFKQVAQAAGVTPFLLDDFLWMFGRKCCPRDPGGTMCARCGEGCRRVGGCLPGGCIFADICYARSRNLYLPEHTYLNTWYY